MQTTDDKQKILLKNSELTNYMGDDELGLLLQYSKLLTYAPSTTILRQGKRTQGIYFILEGEVLVTAKLLGEGTTHLETLDAGKFFGEVSFIEKIPSATSIIANDHVSCLLITYTYMEFLNTYYPATKYKLLLAITNQICKRLKKMHEKIIQFISNSDMASRPLFSEIIQSLTKPTEISLDNLELKKIAQDLHKTPCFNTFTASEILELLQHSVAMKASNHCILIRKDEKNASCYIVLHGAVQSSIFHANRAAKLSVIGPATLFASIGCIDCDSNFTISFTTCEQAILFRISEAELEYFKKESQALWYKIFDLIAKSLAALEKSVDKLDIRLNIEIYNR